jgi:hypothetical protein
MNNFRKSRSWSEAPRWNARPSPLQSSETPRERLRVLTVSFLVAFMLGGWSCDAANPPTQFDGSFDLERLPVGHRYNLYAEPLVGLALPGDFNNVIAGLCSNRVAPTCTAPPVNTNFNVRVLPAVP